MYGLESLQLNETEKKKVNRFQLEALGNFVTFKQLLDKCSLASHEQMTTTKYLG